MMNKFRKVCSASLCAVSLNSLGAGATSAIKIDIKIEDIGEICPNIHRKWADIYFKLLTLEYFKGNAFDWRKETTAIVMRPRSHPTITSVG